MRRPVDPAKVVLRPIVDGFDSSTTHQLPRFRTCSCIDADRPLRSRMRLATGCFASNGGPEPWIPNLHEPVRFWLEVRITRPRTEANRLSEGW